jgi:hypothetical protein
MMRWERPKQRDRHWDLRNDGLKERFRAFLSENAPSHDDWSPERIAEAFIAANPGWSKSTPRHLPRTWCASAICGLESVSE